MRRKKDTIWGLIFRTTFVSLLFVAVISLFVNPTSSWFRDITVTSNEPTLLVVGTIRLETVTNFNYYNLTLAPDTIYTRDNSNSDIATYVRTHSDNDILDVFVRIKFITNRSELTLYFADGQTTTASSYSSACNNKWYYNSADQYWYYIGTINQTYTKFNAGYAVDNTLTNAKANAPVEITFIFEGLQKPYGAYHTEWPNAPAVFTGYASTVTGA